MSGVYEAQWYICEHGAYVHDLPTPPVGPPLEMICKICMIEKEKPE